MKVLIEPEAEAEIEVAAAWYQMEAPGLGNEFLRAVEIAVSILGRQPMAFTIAYVTNTSNWFTAFSMEFVL